jgi:hypothetical protein
MLLVTAFAALAAAGSFWAAMKQEQATFTNTLYTKQTDTLGNFFANATALERELQAFFVISDQTQITTLFLEKDIPSVTKTALGADDPIIGSISRDLETAQNTAVLVLPTVLTDHFKQTSTAGDNIERRFHILTNAIVGGQYKDTLNTLIPGEITGLFANRKVLNDETSFLFSCVHDLLLNGKPVLDADAKKCLTRPDVPKIDDTLN